MCGISGIFNYRDGAAVDPEALRRMTDAIVHRGPDDAGHHVDGPCGLGFRRLSIIDLSTGHQPVRSPDGERAVMLNGEIYNYLELRPPLEAAGRRFSTRSDTEVVLAAYERYGTDCVEKLRGMFGIAIWDRPKRRLFLARDRLGVKPLYVADDGRRLLFGSEIKAILAAGGVDKSLDHEAVADYLALRYVPGPKSIFKSIRKLPPGHWMLVEEGREPIVRQYWDVRFEPDHSVTEAEWIERLRALLDESVRIRMISDVPLGAFLSGGVDSSAVVATMARLSKSPVSTHTIGFRDAAFDETASARVIAERYRTDHHVRIIEPDAVSVVETLAWHFDEPFADASAVPTYYVSRMAREKVTVALSGDGGDENFAGYPRRYAFERREDAIRRRLPLGLRRILFGLPARLYPKADWLPRPLRAKTTLTNLSRAAHEAYFNTMALGTTAAGMSPLASAELRATLRGYRPSDLFRDLMARAGTDDPVSRAQYVDFKSFLVDDVMVKVDRASMAVSLEAREPVLDHVLVETAARIPSSLKLVGSEGKVIFKKAVEDRVDRELLDRRKQGFEVPIASWFRGPLRSYAEDVIFRRPSPADPWLDAAAVRQLWDRHQSGLKDGAHPLWSVLMLKLWAGKFL